MVGDIENYKNVIGCCPEVDDFFGISEPEIGNWLPRKFSESFLFTLVSSGFPYFHVE